MALLEQSTILGFQMRWQRRLESTIQTISSSLSLSTLGNNSFQKNWQKYLPTAGHWTFLSLQTITQQGLEIQPHTGAFLKSRSTKAIIYITHMFLWAFPASPQAWGLKDCDRTKAFTSRQPTSHTQRCWSGFDFVCLLRCTPLTSTSIKSRTNLSTSTTRFLIRPTCLCEQPTPASAQQRWMRTLTTEQTFTCLPKIKYTFLTHLLASTLS